MECILNKMSIVLFWFLLVLSGIPFSLNASQRDTLYINQGTRIDEGVSFPVLQFNHSAAFSEQDAFVLANTNGLLELVIINTSSHSFTIEIEGQTSGIVNAAESIQLNVILMYNHTNRIYAKEDWARYLGLSSLIVCAKHLKKNPVWNLRDTEKLLNNQVLVEQEFAPSNFIPDFFTVNYRSWPDNTVDTMSVYKGHVGDSIHIHILNSGQSIMPIHFHGYHVRLEKSNKNNHQIGWVKDSFPVKVGEVVTVLLVPHQPGMFPVHNHNLTTITKGGNYPGGMMTKLHIMP